MTALQKHTMRDEALVITAGETLDNNNAHEMYSAITEALDKGFKFIVIDMTALQFLSSAGVGSVLGTVETARDAGGDIILANLTQPVQHVLSVLDLADYLTIKKSTQDALAYVEAH